MTARQVGGRRLRGRGPKDASRTLARHLAANTIDGRSWVARALKSLRDDLAADAGGWDRLSRREQLLLDRACAVAVIAMSIEGHVWHHGPLDNGDLRGVLKKGYLSHVNTLANLLGQLGLRPDKVERLPDLAQYLAAQTSAATPAQDGGDHNQAPRPPVADSDTKSEGQDPEHE